MAQKIITDPLTKQQFSRDTSDVTWRIRRVPVAERSNAISLTDIISLTGESFHPSTLLVTLITLLSPFGGSLVSAHAERTTNEHVNCRDTRRHLP